MFSYLSTYSIVMDIIGLLLNCYFLWYFWYSYKLVKALAKENQKLFDENMKLKDEMYGTFP